MELNMASRMNLLSGEGAYQVLAKAQSLEAAGKSVVHMEIGQPDFRTPQHIIDAAHQAMLDGFTGYTASPGLMETRQAVADYFRRYKQIAAEADQVVVVPGAKPVIFYTVLQLVDPGDEVIYPNPGFPTYESVIRFAGGVPVPLPILQENHFKVDPDDLRRLLSPKTKLLVINNPANPTGGFMNASEITEIASIIRDSNAFVLSDEIYDRLVYSGEKPLSIASLPGMQDRTIVLDGLSKTYSMTGWRVGYGLMSRDLARGMSTLMTNSCGCTAAFTQKAVIAALTGPQDTVEKMKESFRQRVSYLVNALNEIPGIDCLMPEGAFYVFPSIRGLKISSDAFADRLLSEGGVAALSGTGFGRYGEGHFRLSAATSMENIKEAVKRIRQFVETL